MEIDDDDLADEEYRAARARRAAAEDRHLREDLERLRAVWRAVAREIAVAPCDLPDTIKGAAFAADLARYTDAGALALTPDGTRLANHPRPT